MNRILRMALVPVLFAAAAAQAGTGSDEMVSKAQTVSKSGSEASFKGPEQFFTGNVNVYMSFSPTAELPASGAFVIFEPGARSAWHTHPAGQTLIVISGAGLTQEWGQPVVEIHPGDVIRCPAGVKHWHGAEADSWFIHLAVEVPGEGTRNEWCEPVSDEEYSKLNLSESEAL